MCCVDYKRKGLTLLVIGVLVWLNGMYNWVTWAQFFAIVLIVLGVLAMFAPPVVCAVEPAKKPAKKRRKR